MRDGRVMQATEPAPPAGSGENRMLVLAPARKIVEHPSERGGSRSRRAQVVNARFVMTIFARQQIVPVICSQKRPGRDGAQRFSFLSQTFRTIPNLFEPAQLLFARAAQMRFRDCQRQLVTIQHLFQKNSRSSRSFCADAHGLHVRVNLATISAMRASGIARDSLVKKALARQVMIDAYYIGHEGVLYEPLKLCLLYANPTKIIPHGV